MSREAGSAVPSNDAAVGSGLGPATATRTVRSCSFCDARPVLCGTAQGKAPAMKRLAALASQGMTPACGSRQDTCTASHEEGTS
ncbi:hypothetical protein HaLaN_00729, partial [Haematococcus lacustris]